MTAKATWFQRVLLPGFAFKAVVIGGGYATGRELAEYFLPSGPWGGIAGMTLAMMIWSVVCALTFIFARQVGANDYRQFFQALLGRGWVLFEVVYALFIIVILAVFAAAAGAIGQALFGWPVLAGTLVLIVGIAAAVTFGNTAVERLFQWVTVFLYGVYALFLVVSFTSFGHRIVSSFALHKEVGEWALGGVTYAGYNVIGAVVVLPTLRHSRGARDAALAGLLAGPLAMLPALLFFICMAADYPDIGHAALPSNVLLLQLHQPTFRVLFQAMIFAALLESGTGGVHAINERIANARLAWGSTALTRRHRLAVALTVLVGSVFLANWFGLVALIAQGYRLLSYAVIAVFVLPLLTIGLRRILRFEGSPLSRLHPKEI